MSDFFQTFRQTKGPAAGVVHGILYFSHNAGTIGHSSDILDLSKPPMPLNSDKLPELVIVDEDDPATARRIRRLAVEGSLRRLRAA